MPVAPTRFTRTDWLAETESLRRADEAGPLDPDGVARLALALELTGRSSDAVHTWDRAHRAHLAAGNRGAAARCVFWIGFTLATHGEPAQARAWGERLAHLAAGERPGSLVHALLLTAEAFARFEAGDLTGSVERFERAAAAAERLQDLDLQMLTAMGCGRALVAFGETARGFACMDRVMLGIATGDAGDLVAGSAYCSVIASCLGRRDVERAREWTRALGEWCDAQAGLVPFRGECVLHRATLLQVGGAWQEAEETVERLMRAESGERVPLGNAHYREAELFRLTGRFDDAELSYRAAVDEGHEGQPGLGLLRLAQGRTAAARVGLSRALGLAVSPGDRADLLAALVEVTLVERDTEAAAAAAEELQALAQLIDTSYLRAQADRATGCLLLHQGDPAGALRILRRAWTGWRRIDAPYEAARTRISVAIATQALGDEDAAGMEFDAARHVLVDLGAINDVDRLDAAASGRTPGALGPLTAREVEVLRLVTRGCSNRDIAEHLFVSERTAARHMSNILTKLQLANRAAATAYAYQHGIAGTS